MVEVDSFINYSWLTFIICLFRFLFDGILVILLVDPNGSIFDIFYWSYILFSFIGMVVVYKIISRVKKVKKMIEENDTEKIDEDIESLETHSKFFAGASLLLIIALLSVFPFLALWAYYFIVILTVIQMFFNFSTIDKLKNWENDEKNKV